MDIEVFFEEGMKVNARVGNHVIKTDQKSYGGGQDSAPSPFDYFLTSLGTCAGIFVKIFCEKRGIDTAGIKILQKHVVDQKTHKMTNINMEIVLFVEEVPDSLQLGAPALRLLFPGLH